MLPSFGPLKLIFPIWECGNSVFLQHSHLQVAHTKPSRRNGDSRCFGASEVVLSAGPICADPYVGFRRPSSLYCALSCEASCTFADGCFRVHILHSDWLCAFKPTHDKRPVGLYVKESHAEIHRNLWLFLHSRR